MISELNITVIVKCIKRCCTYLVIYINFKLGIHNSKNRHGVTLPSVKYYMAFITTICNETDTVRILHEHDTKSKKNVCQSSMCVRFINYFIASS